MKLYRYISLVEFLEITMCKQLRLKHPVNWPDKYEGYLYNALAQKSGQERFAMLLGNQELSESNLKEISKMIDLFTNHVYCTCCSTEYNNVLMWNAYNYENKSIMIELNEEALYMLAEDIQIHPVIYDLEDFGIDGYVKNIKFLRGSVGIISPESLLCHKRMCFSYEKEIRIILNDFSCTDDTKMVPIHHLDQLICDVLVHPLAPKEYVRIIESICNASHICFSGKSNVYTLDKLY